MYDEGQELHKQYTALHRSFIALSRQNKAEEAVALLNGKALEKIVTMADGTADLVRALVTASKQQSASRRGDQPVHSPAEHHCGRNVRPPKTPEHFSREAARMKSMQTKFIILILSCFFSLQT